MSLRYKISGCGNCPLKSCDQYQQHNCWADDDDIITHQDIINSIYSEAKPYPENCPLNKNLYIKFKLITKEDENEIHNSCD